MRAFSALPGRSTYWSSIPRAGIGESVLQFCQSAQQVLLVLRDEPTSLTDAYALIKVLSRTHGVRHFRVLANMTRHAGQGESVFRRLQRVTDRYLDVALDFVGEIPEDGALQKVGAGAARGAGGVSDRARPRRRSIGWRDVASRWPLPVRSERPAGILLRAHAARGPAPQLRVLK